MRKHLRVSALAIAAATSLTVGLQAPGNAANKGELRITSVGGMNVVPTPSGLHLGSMEEKTMSTCGIGSGCAARTWTKTYGGDANNPEQVLTYVSNVGFLPTSRLAKHDMNDLKEQFQTFAANGGFVGKIKKSSSGGMTKLIISGRFDQTVDDHVRIVQLRDGVRTVLIAADMDNRLSERAVPSDLTTENLSKKAKSAMKRNWGSVPTTVLP